MTRCRKLAGGSRLLTPSCAFGRDEKWHGYQAGEATEHIGPISAPAPLCRLSASRNFFALVIPDRLTSVLSGTFLKCIQLKVSLVQTDVTRRDEHSASVPDSSAALLAA
jgi:hypothetical protein